MDYQALNTLIQTHPSWPSVDDDILLAWVNEEAISATHATLSSGQIFATIADNISEFNALTDANKQTVRDILYIHSGEGVPTAVGSPARNLLVSIFGGGSSTIAALGAAIAYLITRAASVGIIETVRKGDIEYARTL